MSKLLFRFYAIGLLAASLASHVGAADYPTRPIRLLVGYAAGGGTDSVARIFGQRLSEVIGQPIVIENRPGAGGNLAAQLTAQAPADGYTIHIVASSFATNPSLYSNAGYDPVNGFAPVSLVASTPYVLEVTPSLAARSVKELIEMARAEPGKLTYASGGTGTPSHLGVELIKSMAGIDLLHVPYKGGGQALTDLMGGQVHAYLDPIVLAAPNVKSGRTRALAVTSLKRSPVMPDVPTVAESGLPGYEITGWYAIFAPVGTPADVVDILNRNIAKALESAEIRKRFLDMGLEPIGAGPEPLRQFMQTEITKWNKVIKASGAKVD
ncbi:MAG: Bug family tripartite tricarboxylate transporter substrate binding protein [Lautropia sp.]